MNQKQPTATQPRCTLRRPQRLRTRTDFNSVYNYRLSAADNRLVVYALPNNRPHPRMGLSVGKRLGSAVTRNRYKRALRQAFRLQQHHLPDPYDYVLIPRLLGPCSADLYAQSLRHLARKLHRRQLQRDKKK